MKWVFLTSLNSIQAFGEWIVWIVYKLFGDCYSPIPGLAIMRIYCITVIAYFFYQFWTHFRWWRDHRRILITARVGKRWTSIVVNRANFSNTSRLSVCPIVCMISQWGSLAADRVTCAGHSSPGLSDMLSLLIVIFSESMWKEGDNCQPFVVFQG